MCHKKLFSFFFSMLVLGTLMFSSVHEADAKSRIWGRIKNFLGATVAPGLDGPVDPNDSRFGCKAGGSYSGSVWCEAYGSTYDLHVSEAAKHQGIVVMVQRYSTDGSGRGYFMTGDYGPAVPSATYGNLAANAVVHCPTGATTGNHTRGHMIYSPNLRGMFDVGGETHFWCIQNTSIAVNPLPGPEVGQPMPDIHYKTYFTKVIQDGKDFFKYAGSNNSLNPKIQALASNGYVKCLYGKSGPFGTDQHYHCLTPDGSAEVDIDWNNVDVLVAGEAPPNYTLTVSPSSGSIEVKAGAKANSKFMLWNAGAAGTFTVSCSTAPQATSVIQNANTTEPPFSSTASADSVSLSASAGKNFIYSIDVSTLPVGTATVTCTAKAPNETIGKSATDTVTLIAPVLHAAPDVNYPTGFTTAVTQYGANKYSITVGDVDGIKEFSVWTKTGGVGTISIYSGSPGAAGNAGACGGAAMIKTITSGTVTLESTDFLLMGSLTDCRTGAVKYDYKIGMPSGGGTEPVPTQPIACSNGVKCPKGSWCSSGQKFYYPTSEITCVAWSIDGSIPPAPAGTTECDPPDSNCVNTGQTVDYSSSKWCGRGMRYFSKDGLKMTCVAWNAEAPIGFSACSPTETTCKGKGDTWTKDDLKASQYYCSNAKKCTLADGGGTCVGNMETCPAGSKYCQATDTNCVEPGTYRTLPTGTGTQQWFWCGGGGMQFYSLTQVYCEGSKVGGTTPATMMFTGADIKAVLAKLGSGWQLCNPQQTSSYGKCLEPGQIGRSEDWCAWWPPQPAVTPGTTAIMMPVFHDPNKLKACPNFDGITPTIPEPEKPKPPIDPEIPCPSFMSPLCTTGQILKFTEGKCRTPYCANEGGGGEPIKPPSACAIGETCSSNSWCNMSKQCYYPDSKITCARWDDSCPKGTKACSPADTKCIEPGATGPTDGWCKDSMECFVDGKKFCQPMPMGMGVMHEPPQCPAGSKLCPPNDTNCIEPGKTGPLNGWCKNAMECYSSDGKEKLCQAWKPFSGSASATAVAPAMTMMDESCPSGFKKCRPDDKYCVELGETSKPDNKNGWCAGGRQCYKPDNTFYCAKWSEECPKDSKVCRPDDQGCVEPGKSTTKTDGWCGGNAVRCNNKDVKTPGFSCIAVNTMNDPAAWEKVSCPAGTSRCSTSDSGCMEFGEKRTPGDSRGSLRFAWCTSGMKRENTDGSVECVSFNDYQQKPVTPDPDKEKPEEKFCIQVSAIAYDPSTKVCKEFSTPCKIPNGWKEISSNEKCQDGKLVEFLDALQEVDYNGFGQLLADERKHLDDLYVRLKVLPASVAAGKTVRAKIEDAVKLLKKLGTEAFKKSRKLADLQAELGSYRSTTLKDIDSSFDALKSNIEFSFLAKDLGRRLADYELEWKAQDADSEYAKALKDGIGKLRDLLKSAESQTGSALDQIITVIKEVSSGLESLVSENRSGVTSDYLSGMIESLTGSIEKLQTFIDEKEIKDNKIEFMMGKLYAILSDVEEGEQGLGAGDLSRKLDEGTTIVQRVSKWLADYGLTKQEKIEAKVDEAFSHLEVKLQKRVDEMLDKFANKVEVIVNAALMKVAENAAIVSQRLEKVVLQVKDQLAQSLSNLTAVPENHRDAITETKNEILSDVEDVEKHLETAKLAPDLSERLRTTMAMAATYNWCGDVGEQVKAWMTRTNLALEAKTLADEQVANFETDMGKLTGKNNEECYRIGAAAFRDVPTHEWYYAATEYNKSNDYIKGYADSRGNSTGKFGPADPTLRIEALAMATRIYGIPQGDTDSLSEVVPGVPPWGVGYVNGAVKAGFTFDAGKRLDEPITRAEVAEMFATLGGDKVDLSTPIDSAVAYKDYATFKADPEALKAIDALSDLEILKGSGGYFRPDDPLVRSEFATINQRVVTNLGLEKEEETK